MKSPATVSPSLAGKFFSSGNRRDFLKTAAAGSAAVAIPALLSSCKVGDTVIGTGNSGPTGPLLIIDFAKGDTAYLQFLYCHKQVQADFYARTVAAFTGSDLTATEQVVITDIKNHEFIHRDTLKAILGANALTVTPKFGSLAFKTASESVTFAGKYEDLTIGLINGMLQHLISSANIALLLEMQSVEARHSAAIRDELFPKSGASSGFSPGASDPAYALSGVAGVIQPFVTESFVFPNAPAGL
ncbi:MAG: ferritin-like domain-containing protein [Gemmatimonadaceae bacterium]|nr:ferritin-like domain-containing protein [Gemmatimonadaceae bacterium]